MEICFDIKANERKDIQKRLIRRYKHHFAGTQDIGRLTEIVDDYMPDLRTIANHLEFEFGGN